ncbi:MAG: peptidylprolyl isomerase [Acidimicrobiia bacterium]|nr:peptidylprolyl isomerase [Acidimicrobiia bacterium]
MRRVITRTLWLLDTGPLAIGLAFWLAGSGPVAAQTGTSPKQAVVETTLGTFIVDITPETGPTHAAYFLKQAEAGAYDGTTFHRMVKNGMIMGGDPISKDPAKQAQYGTGGQNALKAEARAPKMTGGSVAAVLVPGRPDSGGAQFFIVLVDQPALDNQYTVFARVNDGMGVLQKISETPIDTNGKATARVEITRITIRDTPPPEPEPFVNETAQELGTYRAILDTSAGPIMLEFLIDKAPEHVRQFLKLAKAGVYDGMAFHRVAPGFVIQTGALNTREQPLTPKQHALVHNMRPEINDTKHVKGIVSLARGDAPDSGTTSFFICTGTSTALDGVYTAFARVVDGMAAVEAIEASPRTGETPNVRIDLKAVRLVKKDIQ